MIRNASNPALVVRDVDVRGFSYALEPVRQRQQWRLDKLMTELARARKALAQTESQRDELRRLHDARARAATQTLQRRLDPAAHRRTLDYLAGLQEQAQQYDEQCRTGQAACVRLQAECVERQLRIDGLAQHKDEALADYAHCLRQRADAEQDRAWLARPAARSPGSECGQ